MLTLKPCCVNNVQIILVLLLPPFDVNMPYFMLTCYIMPNLFFKFKSLSTLRVILKDNPQA